MPAPRKHSFARSLLERIFPRTARSRRRNRKPPGARPSVEVLEDRTLLAVITWISEVSASWHSPSNWFPNRVPAAGDDVVIPDQPGALTITFSTGTSTIRSLEAHENLL